MLRLSKAGRIRSAVAALFLTAGLGGVVGVATPAHALPVSVSVHCDPFGDFFICDGFASGFSQITALTWYVGQHTYRSVWTIDHYCDHDGGVGVLFEVSGFVGTMGQPGYGHTSVVADADVQCTCGYPH
jgi:hypothetical protein